MQSDPSNRREGRSHQGDVEGRDFAGDDDLAMVEVGQPKAIQSPKLSPQTKAAIRKFIGNANHLATTLVLPRSRRRDVVDGPYEDAYNCWPPPITIFIVTLIEIAVFLYYIQIYEDKVPHQSPLIYNPKRRYEAWRYVSYMLIHAGYVHIGVNVFIQLVLGIPLEMVHKYWRVWLVYISGVLAGSLGTSIADPATWLAGASGGVYALITAHLATIIMNFKEMEHPIWQLAVLLVLMAVDLGSAIYDRCIIKDPNNRTSYAAHIAGGVAGLLIGIVALKNLKQHRWEQLLWWLSLSTFIVFIATMIIWNIAVPSYFPVPQ